MDSLFSDKPIPVISRMMEIIQENLLTEEGIEKGKAWIEGGDPSHLSSFMCSVLPPYGRVPIPNSITVGGEVVKIVETERLPKSAEKEFSGTSKFCYFFEPEPEKTLFIPKKSAYIEKIFSIIRFLYDSALSLVDMHFNETWKNQELPLEWTDPDMEDSKFMNDFKSSFIFDLFFKWMTQNGFISGTDSRDFDFLLLQQEKEIEEIKSMWYNDPRGND